MLQSVTICICRREGGMCGKPGWQYTRMTAPLARNQNEMCKQPCVGPHHVNLSFIVWDQELVSSHSCPLRSLA